MKLILPILIVVSAIVAETPMFLAWGTVLIFAAAGSPEWDAWNWFEFAIGSLLATIVVFLHVLPELYEPVVFYR